MRCEHVTRREKVLIVLCLALVIAHLALVFCVWRAPEELPTLPEIRF